MSVLLDWDIAYTILDQLGSPFSKMEPAHTQVFSVDRGYYIDDLSGTFTMRSFIATPSNICLSDDVEGTVIYLNLASDERYVLMPDGVFVGFADPSKTLAPSKHVYTKANVIAYIRYEFRTLMKLPLNQSLNLEYDKLIANFIDVIKDDTYIYSSLQDVVSCMVSKHVYPFNGKHVYPFNGFSSKVVSWLN